MLFCFVDSRELQPRCAYRSDNISKDAPAGLASVQQVFAYPFVVLVLDLAYSCQSHSLVSLILIASARQEESPSDRKRVSKQCLLSIGLLVATAAVAYWTSTGIRRWVKRNQYRVFLGDTPFYAVSKTSLPTTRL